MPRRMFSEIISKKDNVGYRGKVSILGGGLVKSFFKSLYYSERNKMLFSLPGVYSKVVSLDFKIDQPLSIIDGNSGSGKTILATALMEQALKQGKPVTYFVDRKVMQSKDIITAKVMGLMSTYPCLFKIQEIDKGDQNFLLDSLYVIREELLVIDDVLGELCGLSYQKFVNLLKARPANAVIITLDVLEISRAFSLSYESPLESGIYRDMNAAYDALLLLLGHDLSFVLSWGESELNEGTPPIGQFVLRNLKRKYMEVIYIPEI